MYYILETLEALYLLPKGTISLEWGPIMRRKFPEDCSHLGPARAQPDLETALFPFVRVVFLISFSCLRFLLAH